MMSNKIAEIIRCNVQKLVDKHELNTVSLGRKASLDQKTAYNLLNPEKVNSFPTTNTIYKISKYFKIEFWKLVFKDMPLELMKDKKLDDLIRQYARCSQDNRDKILNQVSETARIDQLEKELSKLKEQ